MTERSAVTALAGQRKCDAEPLVEERPGKAAIPFHCIAAVQDLAEIRRPWIAHSSLGNRISDFFRGVGNRFSDLRQRNLRVSFVSLLLMPLGRSRLV